MKKTSIKSASTSTQEVSLLAGNLNYYKLYFTKEDIKNLFPEVYEALYNKKKKASK